MKKRKLMIVLGCLLGVILIYNFDIITYVLVNTFGENTTNTLFFSDSVAEAKSRGTYICDIKSINYTYKANDSLKLETKRGWLEKGWHGHTGGTTNLDSEFYTINFIPISNGNIIDNVSIVCPEYGSEGAGGSRIGFIPPVNFASINKLPASDSIRYYVLQENKDEYHPLDFAKNHIIDSFYVVLDRKH